MKIDPLPRTHCVHNQCVAAGPGDMTPRTRSSAGDVMLSTDESHRVAVTGSAGSGGLGLLAVRTLLMMSV